MNINLNGIVQWITVLQQLEAKGKPAWDSVKKTLADHGIEADTAALDEVIADAARRKAQAERDAAGPSQT